MKKSVLKYTVAALLLGGGSWVGYNYIDGHMHQAEAAGDAAAMPAAMAMPVDVAVIAPEAVQIWKNFSGHVVAVDHADIRPQVSGRIHEIHFDNGQHVEKGDLLMVIDPRPYEARLNQAKAALQAAETQANLAEKEYQRAKKLINSDAISQSMLDERVNNREAAAAEVAGAKAAVESAEIDLDYAFVKAPISGKISRAEITEGNLVQAGANAPVLTSIVADDKVYVDFEVDERTYIESVRSTKDKGLTEIPVRVKTIGADAEYQGTVQSFDNHIDTATGTVRARAIFENQDGVLLPGMSVTVLMGTANGGDKILVTERAIGTDQDRKFVYVVGADNTAQYREVKIGDAVSGQRVILSGLEEGETIISGGIVRIRPGIPVAPKAAAAE